MSALTTLVSTTDLTILIYFLVLNSFYAVLLILSIPEIWEQTRLAEDEDFQRLMQSDALPPITLLVPAYNESATIEASVTAILTLEYRNYEVVVVNDGSKDDTLEQLRHAFDLYEIPRVYPETIETKPLRALYRSRCQARPGRSPRDTAPPLRSRARLITRSKSAHLLPSVLIQSSWVSLISEMAIFTWRCRLVRSLRRAIHHRSRSR